MSVRVAWLIASGLHPGPYHCERCGQEIDARRRIDVEEANEIETARIAADLWGAGAGAAVAGFVVGAIVGFPPLHDGFATFGYWSVVAGFFAASAALLPLLGMVIGEWLLEWRQRTVRRIYRQIYKEFVIAHPADFWDGRVLGWS